jgi:hypothetical protein
VRRAVCQPRVKHAGGEGDHEKVVQGGPRNVHQNASKCYVAAIRRIKTSVRIFRCIQKKYGLPEMKHSCDVAYAPLRKHNISGVQKHAVLNKFVRK